ncbi:MAG TPA: hypothetical protein PKY05_16430, partial [Fibrobacteria bacterium]|nr:hypothetical protein [Fibrobacteria bacterium]
WNSTTGKSMVKGGYSLNGDLLADSSSVFSHTFVLESNDYLEAAVPMMGYDSGYTFLASFRFDSLPPTGNLVRLSGDNDNYSLAMDSTESLPRQARLVWGERFSDTVFGQSAPPSDPNGTSRIDLGTDLPIAVSFAPTQTIAYRLGSPSAPLPPLTMTNKSLAGGHFVEVGGFGRSIGFAGTMSLPRLSRGVMDPNRLALEAFNLQTQPSWIRVDRHGSVTGPSKNP